MKNLQLIAVAVGVIGLILTANFLFRSEFKSGWCVKDNRDGYVWQINDFSFGKYRVMGWQDGAWGNAVSMEKGVLERKDIGGIKVYIQTACPEYRPKSTSMFRQIMKLQLLSTKNLVLKSRVHFVDIHS